MAETGYFSLNLCMLDRPEEQEAKVKDKAVKQNKSSTN
jgi:hypothetical protein